MDKLPKLTKKQQIFAREYLETGNGTQSALKAYNTESSNTAGALAHENLRKPNVKAYLESKADRAAEIVFELAETAENETVRLNASKDILDRTGHKVIEPDQTNTSGNTYNFLFSAETQASVKEIEEKIKQSLIKQHVQEN